MRTGPTTLPGKSQREGDKPRRLLPRLGDTRIRSKLALILVVPVAAVLALAAIRLVDIGQGAYDAGVVRSLAELSTNVSALTQDIHKERIAAAKFLASPTATPDSYNALVKRTDERIVAYNDRRDEIGDVPDSVADRLDAIKGHLDSLNGTRQEVQDRQQTAASEAVLRYGVIMTDLVAYGAALGQLSGEGPVGDSLRAVSSFSLAKLAVAEQEGVLYTALTNGQLDEEQFFSFTATLTSQQEALVAFTTSANLDQRALVNSTVTGDGVGLADEVITDVTRSVGQPSPVTAEAASAAVGSVNDLMRWAETLLEIGLLSQADEARSEVIQQAIIESIIVIITLILAVALAVVLARSLNQSLRRLREGALSVANHDLPEAVKRLRDVGNIGDGGVDEIVRQVRDPIQLSNRDEVGQVALAFNVVHKEAVRIAAEQAALRTSVSTMFLSLARRSQTLVDRMIGELDAIERGEEDPKRLAQLFELDHLATRMRRNDENLLVLAGADSTAPRRDDALLIDALRAAQSEVELYNRIEFGTVDTDIAVAAHAVNDVVRLVAELLDNATRFSPPHTSVVADARRIRDYVLIQVEDRGLGLSDEQMDALNRRLAAPPAVDVAAFRLMGLAVVSRLASRYAIRVELRRNVEGGTVAQVTLPNSTVVLPQPRGRDQVLGRPRQTLAVESGPSTSPAASSPSSSFGWETPAGATAAPAPRTESWRTSAAPAQWQTNSQPAEAMPVNASAQQPAARLAAQLSTHQQPAAQSTSYQPSAQSASYQPAAQQAGYQQAAPHQPVTHLPAQAPTAAYQTVSPPTMAPASAAMTPAQAYLDQPAATNAGSPTMAYPTVGSLPRRTADASQGVAPAAAAQSGMPTGPVAGASSAITPRPEDTGEAPIFREMEAVWFRSHGQDSTAIFTIPAGGLQPQASGAGAVQQPQPQQQQSQSQSQSQSQARDATPNRAPLAARTPGRSAPPPSAYPAPQVPAPAPAPPPVPVPPRPSTTRIPPPPAAPSRGGNEAWRTAADEGWARATQAAEPTTAGITRSGLPKRVPQAQLVPGGVEPKAGRGPTRRTPDEVRGLLSAYHRGVQRGRTAGVEQNGISSTKETSE